MSLNKLLVEFKGAWIIGFACFRAYKVICDPLVEFLGVLLIFHLDDQAGCQAVTGRIWDQSSSEMSGLVFDIFFGREGPGTTLTGEMLPNSSVHTSINPR